MKRFVPAVMALFTASMLLQGCSNSDTAPAEQIDETKETKAMHPNEEMARSAYAAFNKKDIPAVMSVFDDGITLVVPGNSIQSGTFAGKSGMGQYFSTIGKFTGGTHTVEPLEVLADDDRIVALMRAKGTHGAKVFDMTVIHLFKVVNGKITEFQIIPTDQYAFDQFWSE